MPSGIIQSAFPHLHRRSSSSTDIPKAQHPRPHPTGPSPPAEPAAKPQKPQRPQPVRAASHPGPAPVSHPAPKKQPPRAFGTNYRVRRTPPGTPPNERVPSSSSSSATTTPSGPPALSSVRDFAPAPPTRRKPVYSLHEADPAAKGRPEVVYTHEELLKRLNTIGEDEETDVDRVRTGDRAAGMDWEEGRRRKEERDMEDWNRKEAKKAQRGLVRGFSWKGVKKTVGGFR
ncbi:hypothetical protein PMIN06_006201 [Paraphaeosphaeria minitans]|uniref:Uncharacterized protein n=1 Tax=Paraphaeosphaeria minitans TaxID=565426 RepID=A0A9P6GVF1_9PLEO|nr:hypothetical protein PMIN01_01349 [Paraphaeosphaeria minitans]